MLIMKFEYFLEFFKFSLEKKKIEFFKVIFYELYVIYICVKV